MSVTLPNRAGGFRDPAVMTEMKNVLEHSLAKIAEDGQALAPQEFFSAQPLSDQAVEDYYGFLGVSPLAPMHEIKQAAQARINRIGAIFEILRDSAKRREYDLRLAGSQVILEKQPHRVVIRFCMYRGMEPGGN